MNASRVLIVDDDLTVSSVVSAYLRRAGIDSRTASDGSAAERAWREWKPHLVVLDVMLPGISGFELLRRRRADADHTLVVMLSARGDEDHRIEGLELGADDYVAKPFSPRELVLRVSGLLRRDDRLRSPAGLPPELRAGPLFIDTAGRSVRLRGLAVPFTTREYDLLVFLAAHAGQTFGKRELLRRVWGWDYGDNSTVFVHIRRVREKIERDPSDPRLVLTVRGVGYRFASPEELHELDAPT